MHIFKRGNELHFVEILFLTFILIARERINERLCGEQATDSICIITARTFFSCSESARHPSVQALRTSTGWEAAQR